MLASLLLFLALIGWGTLIALSLWPIRRPHKIAMGLYLLVFRATEVPQVVALLAAATVIPLFLFSNLNSEWLLLAWVGAGLVLAGLCVLLDNGIRSRSAIDRGLAAAGLPPSRPSRSLWSVLLRPQPRLPRSVELVSDISYGDHARHRLDVYRRREAGTPGPILVYFHGGGYFTGDKDMEGRSLLHHLADRGWLCVSATYRLRPEVGMDGHLADARAAIAWARDHAAEYGADPTTLMVAGSSAGTHLAAVCALTPEESTKVDGLICVYSWFPDYAEIFGEPKDPATPTAPFDLDPSVAPPTFIVHGSADLITSPQTARDFAAHLAAATPGPVVSATLPGGQHGFDTYATWRAQALADGVDVFAEAVLAGGSPT